MNTIKGVGKAIITWWPGCGVARGTYHLLGLSISVNSLVVLWNLKKLRDGRYLLDFFVFFNESGFKSLQNLIPKF